MRTDDFLLVAAVVGPSNGCGIHGLGSIQSDHNVYKDMDYGPHCYLESSWNGFGSVSPFIILNGIFFPLPSKTCVKL